MGRNKRINPEGTSDWQIKVLAMPEKVTKDIKIIAAKKKANIGDLIREWIVAGAAKTVKRLKIGR